MLDATMIKVWKCLVRDFHSNVAERSLNKKSIEDVTLDDVPFIRALDMPGCYSVAPYIFKQEAQIHSFLKKYTFEYDAKSIEQREIDTITKFRDTQNRLAEGIVLSRTSKLVIEEARSIILDILGHYDLEEHYASCRFGKKAAVGLRAEYAYLPNRISCLSGTRHQIEWFEGALQYDELLRSLVTIAANKHNFGDQQVRSLTLSTVPKTWKICRTIALPTIVGTYCEMGLAAMLVERLKIEGINMSTQPDFHRALVRRASIDKRLVTADLTSASDSFTDELMSMLIPKEWLKAFTLSRLDSIEMPDTKECEPLNSFMLMGCGYTSSLQTLLFYALLKSIQQWTGFKGIISVFGDDLIYPRKMHKYVCKIFPEMGFKLNADKTFSDLSFRESCGADYYRGVDVRPFSPALSFDSYLKGRDPKQAREAILYYLYNGLASRFSEYDIPITTRYLLTEIAATNSRGEILQVPRRYSEYSGVQVSVARKVWYIPYAQPMLFDDADPSCRLTSMVVFQPNHCDVFWTEPFFWDALRASAQCVVEDYKEASPLRITHPELLRWRKPSHSEKKRLPKKLWKLKIPQVTAKGRGRAVEQLMKVFWF